MKHHFNPQTFLQEVNNQFIISYTELPLMDLNEAYEYYKCSKTAHSNFILGKALYYNKIVFATTKKLFYLLELKKIKLSRTMVYELISLYLNLGQYSRLYGIVKRIRLLRRYSSLIASYLQNHVEEAEIWK